MTTIVYSIKNVEKQFSIENLPAKLYVRLDWNDYHLCEATLEDDQENQPKDMYHFAEFINEGDSLWAFIISYRYNLIEHTEELDQIYDEIVTYYHFRVYMENNEIKYESKYMEPKEPEPA